MEEENETTNQSNDDRFDDVIQYVSRWDKQLIIKFITIIAQKLHQEEKKDIRKTLKRTLDLQDEDISDDEIQVTTDENMECEKNESSTQLTKNQKQDRENKLNTLYHEFPELPPSKKTKSNQTQPNLAKGKQIVKNSNQSTKNQTSTDKMNYNQSQQASSQNFNSSQQSQAISTPKNPRIPPITILDRNHYNDIVQITRDHDIELNQIKNTSKGLQIQVNNSDGHRKLTKILDYNNQKYFTFDLPEDKSLKIVIRGVPTEMNLEYLETEIKNLNFNPLKINRMFKNVLDEQNSKIKIPMPLVLVQLEKTEHNKKFYNLTKIGFLAVKIEPLNIKRQTRQCHRCQSFGHTEKGCHLQVRCHKCAEAHHWTECTKAKNETPTCANCRGDHPANYKGCPNFPKPKKIQNNPRIIERPSYLEPNKTYSQAAIARNNSSDNVNINQILQTLKETTLLLTNLITNKSIQING